MAATQVRAQDRHQHPRLRLLNGPYTTCSITATRLHISPLPTFQSCNNRGRPSRLGPLSPISPTPLTLPPTHHGHWLLIIGSLHLDQAHPQTRLLLTW